MRHTTSMAVMILAAGLFFSCTDGNYGGSGGGGNLNIIDRSASGELNGKYIFARADTGSGEVGLFPRQKVNMDKVSAPLYYIDTGIQYTGNDTFTQFTVSVYASGTASTPEITKNFSSVKFYGGSGLIEWK